MANILHIKNLNYNNSLFGIAGIDVDTGIIKYYFFLDNDCCYEGDNLHFVDIDSLPNCMLKFWIEGRELKRYDEVEKLPDELKPFVSKYVTLHRNYNIQNGFSNKELNANIKNLEICFSEEPDDKVFEVSGRYNSPANFISIVINRLQDSLTEHQKKLEQDVLLHELGHLKVTKYSLDLVNMKLNGSIGFYNFEYKLQFICQIDDDYIYVGKKQNEIGHTIALEEIFNELECHFIKPNYGFCYPEYGIILKELSRGSLVNARHYHDTLEYFRVMKNIIDDENLAQELLDSMFFSLNRSDIEARNKAFTLLKKYERAKLKK